MEINKEYLQNKLVELAKTIEQGTAQMNQLFGMKAVLDSQLADIEKVEVAKKEGE